jgi:predicted RNA-binding protein with PUA domain
MSSVTRLHFRRSVDLLDLGEELQTVAATLNILGRRIVLMNEAPDQEQVNQIGELATRILVAAGNLRKLR